MSTPPLDQDRLFRLVGAFQAAYAKCIDDEGGAAWPDFFTPDCFYLVTTAQNHRAGMPAGLIYAEGRGMLKDRITALQEANIYEQHGYRHVLGQPLIGPVDGDVVKAETSFLVARIMRTGETSVFATGRYLDRFQIADDGLLLRERVVVCDSNQIDTLLALPL